LPDIKNSYTEFKMERCNVTKHFDHPAMIKVKETINFNDYYCFRPEDEIKFGGSWDLGTTYILGLEIV
jgi:hypothetical protein